MKQWLKQGYEPVNFEVEIAKIIHQMDAEIKQQELYKEKLKQCDTFNIIKDRLKKISEICQ